MKKVVSPPETKLVVDGHDQNNSKCGDDEIEIVFAEKNKVDRATWSGKLDFMMTCIGYAVGLGNVWRFPYLAHKNGGGAFLIPYVIMIGVLGLPLFFLEFAFGQFASLGPIQIWSISPLFKGIGYAMVFISWVLSIYYNVIVARCLFFFGASFQTELPWARCGNHWNTEKCLDPQSPAYEYYNRYVLEFSGSITNFGVPVWKLVLSLLGCWIVVFLALSKGVQSLGKISYFTALFPYVILFSLLIRASMLDGAKNGLLEYFTPDFSKLTDVKVWTDAATQIFFSLSVGNGGLIAMSSFNKFKNNCYIDSVIIVIINCATSVFAGMVVYATLGHMAYQKNQTIAEVAQPGNGLVFVVYPEGLTHMPGSTFWSILFFLMMLCLGFGSQFSITESVLSGMQDVFVHHKFLKSKFSVIAFRLGICILNFLMGIPLVCEGGTLLLDLIDEVLSSYPLLFVAFSELIVVSYCYGINQFKRDVALMLNSKPNWYWRATWLIITPTMTFILLIFTMIPSDNGTLSVYPKLWKIFGHSIGVTIVSIIPLYFLFRYCKDGGFIVLRELLKPKQKWGPANKDDRQLFHNMIMSNVSMKNTGKVESRSLQLVTGNAGSTYNIHSSVISRNGGIGGFEDLGGSGFYQSKLSIADKLAEQYTKSLVKTNPELASLLLNPNNTASEAEAMAMSINNTYPSSGNLQIQPSTSINVTKNNLEPTKNESYSNPLNSKRPVFQVGLDSVKS